MDESKVFTRAACFLVSGASILFSALTFSPLSFAQPPTAVDPSANGRVADVPKVSENSGEGKKDAHLKNSLAERKANFKPNRDRAPEIEQAQVPKQATYSMGVGRPKGFLAYNAEVQKQVRAKQSFAGAGRPLAASVTLSIQNAGEVSNAKIAESSGDQKFDESLLLAIRDAGPFPRPPEELRGYLATVTFYFDSKN